MENEVRYLDGYVRAIPDDVEKSRTVEFVISTSDKDRHKSVLNQKKWDLKNYKLNPIVGYQHNLYGDMCSPPNPDDVIGTSKVWIEEDKLIGAVTFEPAEENPLAEKIFRKVLRKSLRTASVGFMALKDKEGKEGYYGDEKLNEHRGGPGETFYYNGQELIEWSIVNIPSNPKAGRRAVRHNIANALVFLKRELGFNFSDIENLRIKDAIDMIENPDSRKLLDTSELMEKDIREALGDEYNEKLTLKGLFAILRGGESEQIEEADTGEAVDKEAREKHLKMVLAKQNYYKHKFELK